MNGATKLDPESGAAERRRFGQGRWILLVCWTLAPMVFVGLRLLTMPTASQFGLGFEVLLLALPWSALGVVFWIESMVSVRRFLAVVGYPAATLVAAALSLLPGRMPLEWTIASTSRATFERHERDLRDFDGDEYRIPEDGYYDGYGAFVRELPSSDAEFGDFEIDGEPVRVPRRTTVLRRPLPWRDDITAFHPLDGGWWYVFRDY
ncbi:MAG: hypothetical protein R3F34_17395 [Planctomycetota bacterium]